MAVQGVRAITGGVGVGVRGVSRMSNGPGVRAPLALLREVVSNTLRNEGEGGNGTAVGEAAQEGKSNLGLDTDLGEGGRERERYAAISGGISRSGVTGRLSGWLTDTAGEMRGISKVDCGTATSGSTSESADSNWMTGVGTEKFPPNLKLFILSS